MQYLFSLGTSRHRFLGNLLIASVIILLFSSASRLTADTAFRLSVSRHHFTINGNQVAYRATAGYLTIKDKKDQPSAHIFYTAYDLDSNYTGDRPLTFIFNGGPGSASIWLHMGAFAPVKVSNAQSGYSNNPYSWLPFTDLVFIDPVGTGFSQPIKGVDAKNFFGYHEDVKSIGAFISKYITVHHRKSSPKFLAGESYGAVRAIGLAAYLQDSLQIKLAGLTLISPALNYRLLSFRPGNDSPYPYYLPTYALAAQYHRRLAGNLEKLTPEQLNAKVTAFSQGTYTKFLQSGAAANSQIIDTLNYYTGLNKSLLRQLNGRITDTRFSKELLTKNQEVTGTFDSRITGQNNIGDPSETAIRSLFTQSFKKYLNTDLEYQNNLPYLATVTIPDWNYGPTANGYLDMSGLLKQVILKHPDLKIKVACGYYDLATPVATNNAIINHLGLPFTLKKNISVDYYHSGHMIYISNEANAQLHSNSAQFYQQTLTAIKS
jgi:carboxypeptidase C (cathepsin A)